MASKLNIYICFNKDFINKLHVVYRVFIQLLLLLNQATQNEKNVHGRPVLKFIEKLHRLYREFIHYLILLDKHQNMKWMTKEGRHLNL
jgi:hypothetical protein